MASDSVLAAVYTEFNIDSKPHKCCTCTSIKSAINTVSVYHLQNDHCQACVKSSYCSSVV